MKKTNKKGFTLIELLAVIVILSVLILIALPAVLNMMNKANKNAFIDEAASIVTAAENAYATEGETGCVIYYYGEGSAPSGTTKLSTDYLKYKTGYTAYITISDSDSKIMIKNKDYVISSLTSKSSLDLKNTTVSTATSEDLTKPSSCS